MSAEIKTMRDVFINELTRRMHNDSTIFFITADFGAPALDGLIKAFPERFINVGIAEQNLINIATGLALEGFKVFAYAIAPFITMRCCEQIKVNLAMMSQLKALNVNLIGVGAGFSYVVSGPTHHSVEDISIIHTLPNIEILSPADWVCAEQMVGFAISEPGPKYFRLDSTPGEAIYSKPQDACNEAGFNIVSSGATIAMVGTGFMVRQALDAKVALCGSNINPAVIDLYRLKNFNHTALAAELSKYDLVISLEEAFVGKGGLDAILLHLKNNFALNFRFHAVGLSDCYRYELGSREELLANYNCSINDLITLLQGNSC